MGTLQTESSGKGAIRGLSLGRSAQTWYGN